MTTPPDPYGSPTPPDPNQPPAGPPPTGQPAYGQPPGAPQYGQPPAPGQHPGVPQPGYGAPASPFGQPGGPQLAEWGTRVGAALIDVLIVVGIIIVAVIIGAIFGAVSDALGTLVVIVGYIAAIGFVFWQLYVQGNTGQTIGKRQLHISLVQEQNGQFVGPGLSIGRYFVHIVDSLPCYLGYLWPLWDDKKQTFADKILKTVVIKA